MSDGLSETLGTKYSQDVKSFVGVGSLRFIIINPEDFPQAVNDHLPSLLYATLLINSVLSVLPRHTVLADVRPRSRAARCWPQASCQSRPLGTQI